MFFKDRTEAAEMLIPMLKKFQHESSVILAIPRGGVPVGSVLSRALGIPMDIVLVKKLGHPLNGELAVGAVSLEDRIVDPMYSLDENYVEEETKKIRSVLKSRRLLYVGNRPSLDLHDKTVIIVDDGISTGYTMKATIRLIRLQHPKRIVIAVPVAPVSTCRELKRWVDEVICLKAEEYFGSVGDFYLNFEAVSDDEVIKLMKKDHPLSHFEKN